MVCFVGRKCGGCSSQPEQIPSIRNATPLLYAGAVRNFWAYRADGLYFALFEEWNATEGVPARMLGQSKHGSKQLSVGFALFARKRRNCGGACGRERHFSLCHDCECLVCDHCNKLRKFKKSSKRLPKEAIRKTVD